MPLLGKHRRDEEEDVFTLESRRQEKRLRDGSDFDGLNQPPSFLQKFSFPPPSQGFSLQTSLPTPSDSEESDDNSPSGLLSPPVSASTEIEMDDEVPEISPKTTTMHRNIPRPARLNPQSLHSHLSESGGRVPTPIKGGFLKPAIPPPTKVGPMASPRYPSAMSAGAIHSRTVTCRPREREYFMPTPVTEAAVETPTAMMGNCLSRLSVSGEENMDMDDNPLPSPRSGRTRSGAITDPKRRFAMGYREDCEKCRQRVPGHFSHFLPG